MASSDRRLRVDLSTTQRHPPLAIDRALNVVVLLPQGTGGGDTSIARFAESIVITREDS